MEYAGLQTLDGTPKNIISSDPKDLEKIIGSFVDEYVMLECDVEKARRQQKEQAEKQANACRIHHDQQSTTLQQGTDLKIYNKNLTTSQPIAFLEHA